MSTPSPGGPGETSRSGLIAGAGAYGLWGLLPLFFPLLAPASAWEIGAHRVIWSLAACLGLLAVTGSLHRLRPLLADRRVLAGLGLASVLLAANWVTFLVAVLTDRVVDAALGYFINPIVTIFLAVLVLGERLRRAQWIAVTIAGFGVVVIAIGYGTLPWISVVLAMSFGLYGLAKNRIGRGVPAVPGLVVETAVLTPISLGFVLYLAMTGTGTFLLASAADGEAVRFGLGWHALLLVSSGVATAAPLVLFAVATRRLPLSTVGLLQFIAPIMQFALGVLILGEEMPLARWAGFVLVWLALLILGAEGYRSRRRAPVPPY